MSLISAAVLPIVLPAPAVFSTSRRVSDLLAVSASAIALAIRFADSPRSLVPAEPGWKHTAPTPSVLDRSISLVRPALALAHFSSSGVATLRTYAACTTTFAGLIFVLARAVLKRATRSGFIVDLSP